MYAKHGTYYSITYIVEYLVCHGECLLKNTYDVEVGEDVSLSILFMYIINIWTHHYC